MDHILAVYLEKGLYGEELSFERASACFWGFLAFFPEYERSLPLAHRALTSWQRQHLGGEGTPVPKEAAALIAAELRTMGDDQSALLVELIFDCYLRSAEWSSLRCADVVSDGPSVALLLGVAERGEKTKTGPNQGVVVDAPAVAADLLERARSKPPEAHVFDISPEAFRKQWLRAKQAANLSFLGPPHDLRHAGASRDVEEKARSLEQVRRRGRWKQLDSVQRYTKTWILVRERSKLSPEQLAKAASLLQERWQRKLPS